MESYYWLLILGFALLVKGSNFLMLGATAFAKRLHIPDINIGLTVLAFGTSVPELFVNMLSGYSDEGEVVYGTLIGSCIFNIFLVLGISGLIRVLEIHSKTVWREIPYLMLAVVAVFIASNDNLFFNIEADMLNIRDSVILFGLFFFFMIYVFVNFRNEPENIDLHYVEYPQWKIIIYIFTGLLFLFIGGKLVLDNALAIASLYQVSKKLVAVTIITTGCCLPELVSCVRGALKNQPDLVIGNIIGANIFNLLFTLPLSGLLGIELTYGYDLNLDMVLLLLGTFIVFFGMLNTKTRKLARWEAALLLLFFVGYYYFLFVRM